MEKSFILFLFLPLSEHTHFFLCLLTILFIPCPPKISTTKEKVMSLQVNWGVGSLNHSLPFLQKITKMKEENNISNLPHFPFFLRLQLSYWGIEIWIWIGFLSWAMLRAPFTVLIKVISLSGDSGRREPAGSQATIVLSPYSISHYSV